MEIDHPKKCGNGVYELKKAKEHFILKTINFHKMKTLKNLLFF
jgi:hypothetical protein